MKKQPQMAAYLAIYYSLSLHLLTFRFPARSVWRFAQMEHEPAEC
ncbi:hypothetical protein AB1K32_26040 [Metabacillus dongyingensis]